LLDFEVDIADHRDVVEVVLVDGAEFDTGHGGALF
jgi:hypothetical protein